MKYGLIGEKLSHSFSKEIHGMIGDYDYELKELRPDELEGFLLNGDFSGINVTIPYKEEVMKHLYYVDANAEEIGAVNTVLHAEGHLFGFNTDIDGMIGLIKTLGIDIKGKRAAILGTGGTSKTAKRALEILGAKEILKVSRRSSDTAITYEELYERRDTIDVIINTTPVGMYPRCDEAPVDISEFSSLSGVVDVIYNPLRTPLVEEAIKRGIPASGGLDMLVKQAVRASEIFLDKKYDEELSERIYTKILKAKENVVLIGMPSSGKTTVGRILSDLSGARFIDTDEEIVKKSGMPIPEIFKLYGEEYFRDLEEDVIREISRENGVIIATGGGAVLRGENVASLHRNGRIVFLDAPKERLMPSSDRPLSLTKEAVEELYKTRYPIYESACDVKIDASGTPIEVSNEIMKRIKE